MWGGVLGAIAMISVYHPVREFDALWHLSQGRDVLRQGTRQLNPTNLLDGFSDVLVAPEWLWDVIMYGLYLLGGWPAQIIFVALIGLGCGFALVQLASRFTAKGGNDVVVLVSGLAMVLVLARLRLRPQAAFFLLLPLHILISYGVVYAKEKGDRLKNIGVLLVIQLLWTQLHGSFILGPAIFVFVSLDCLIGRAPRMPRIYWMATVMGLLVCILTSAWGVDIARYILVHASGDAKRHIVDMMAPTWKIFNPAAFFYGPVYLLMVLLTLIGLPSLKRFPLSELLLAGLGVFLGLTAVRFFVAGGVLLVPLCAAATGALHNRLFDRRWPLWIYVVVALGLLVNSLVKTHEKRGPLGQGGLELNRHPIEAAAFLKRTLKNNEGPTRVMTSLDASSLIAFELDGQVETYVDSRTPVHFDDTDSGVARDVWSDSGAFLAALKRYKIDIIVINRMLPVCSNLAKDWVPVVIEPQFTTFVKSGQARPLTVVEPCGEDYLTPKSCDADKGRLRKELKQMNGSEDEDFLAFVSLSHTLVCSTEQIKPAPKLNAVPNRAYAVSWDRAVGLHRLREGKQGEAISILASLTQKGDLPAVEILLNIEPQSDEQKTVLTGALRHAASEFDDGASTHLRVVLSRLCLSEGDLKCARFHALRALVKGDGRALPIIEWLAQKHPSARVRENMRAWMNSFLRMSRPQEEKVKEAVTN